MDTIRHEGRVRVKRSNNLEETHASCSFDRLLSILNITKAFRMGFRPQLRQPRRPCLNFGYYSTPPKLEVRDDLWDFAVVIFVYPFETLQDRPDDLVLTRTRLQDTEFWLRIWLSFAAEGIIISSAETTQIARIIPCMEVTLFSIMLHSSCCAKGILSHSQNLFPPSGMAKCGYLCHLSVYSCAWDASLANINQEEISQCRFHECENRKLPKVMSSNWKHRAPPSGHVPFGLIFQWWPPHWHLQHLASFHHHEITFHDDPLFPLSHSHITPFHTNDFISAWPSVDDIGVAWRESLSIESRNFRQIRR